MARSSNLHNINRWDRIIKIKVKLDQFKNELIIIKEFFEKSIRDFEFQREGKKGKRTLESSLIKPLDFLLCHFFLSFPSPLLQNVRICVTHPRHGFFLPFADRENRYRTLFF